MTQDRRERWTCVNPRVDWGCSLASSDGRGDTKTPLFATRRECYNNTPCGGDNFDPSSLGKRVEAYLNLFERLNPMYNPPLPIIAALADVRQLKVISSLVSKITSIPSFGLERSEEEEEEAKRYTEFEFDPFIDAFTKSKMFPVWLEVSEPQELERMIRYVDDPKLTLEIMSRRADSLIPFIEDTLYLSDFFDLYETLPSGEGTEDEDMYAQALTRITNQELPPEAKYSRMVLKDFLSDTLGDLPPKGDNLNALLIRLADREGYLPFPLYKIAQMLKASGMPRSKRALLELLQKHYSRQAGR